MASLAPLLLVVSGAAALVYQVTWVRLLALGMGASAASVATVLAAFFGGLTLGSALASRWIRGRSDLLGLFARLELAVGGSGLLLLPVLANLDAVVARIPVLGASLPARFITAALLLGVPTTAMGATFPVLAAHFARRERDAAAVGRHLGVLYALNTVGAVVGTLACGFVLVPRLGIGGAIVVAAGLNLLAATAAWVLARGAARAPLPEPVAPAAEGAPAIAVGAGLALVVLVVTGFASVAAEVAWTHVLALVTGSTAYGFAAMLAAVLTGIALGSAAVRLLMARAAPTPAWLVHGLALLTLAFLLTRAGLAAIPGLFPDLSLTGGLLDLLSRAGLVFLLLLPPTFLLGALFPVALSVACGGAQAVSRRVGPAYALNTMAGIVGSVAAGFVILPRFGSDSVLVATAGVTALGTLVCLPAATGLSRLAAVVVLSASGLLFAWLPGLDVEVLVEAVEYRYGDDVDEGAVAEFLYLEEGHAGIVSAVTYDGRYVRLQNNGLNEARLDTLDPRNTFVVELLLGAMPALLREDPENAFVIGFGGGSTTYAVTLTDVESIRVVELEPAIVRAVVAVLGEERTPLVDPRVELTYDDARHVLVVESQRYDVLVSQPSHPWRSGAGGLFTREFFELVHSRLTDDGVFGQWVNLFQMDADTLRSILKAYFGTFEHGFALAHRGTGDLLLFGSRAPLPFDTERFTRRMATLSSSAALDNHEVYGPREVLGYFALSRESALRAAGEVAPNTDLRLLTEVRLARLHADLPPAQDPYVFLDDHDDFDLLGLLDPATAAQTLETLGRDLIGWDATRRAARVADRLDEIDTAAAARLRAAVEQARRED